MSNEKVSIWRYQLTRESLQVLSAQTCTIYQSEFQLQQYVVGLSWDHGFHESFFTQLLQQENDKEVQSTCPNCRRPIDLGATDERIDETLPNSQLNNTNITGSC